MKTTHILVVVLFTSAIAANALAHNGATGIVKDRMEAMSNLGKAMKNIAEMVRKILPYDANAVRSNAQIIKSHSGLALTNLFPSNSLQNESDARTDIWTNWDEFSELAARLETLATGLQIAADNGLSLTNASKTDTRQTNSPANAQQSEFSTMPVSIIFGRLAKTCASCHEKFRLKKN